MRTYLLLFFWMTCCYLQAQITYTAGDYASAGERFLLSTAIVDTINPPDFSLNGADVAWDYSDLNITTQSTIEFTSAGSSGYQQGFLFTCLASGNNIFFCNTQWAELVNLGIKGEVDINIPNVPISNFTRLANKSNAALANTMVGFSFEQGGFNIPLTSVYENIDTIYQFPLAYQNTFESDGRVVVGITDGPTGDIGISVNTKRSTVVEGYGSLVTPYKAYDNTLKLKTTVQNTDTLVLDSARVAIPVNETITYEWFDLEYGVPVLSATARVIGGFELVTSIQFIDTTRCLQPLALFISTPFQPVADENGEAEISFSNQSINADSLVWDFMDGNTSTRENPTHTFTGGGNTYNVQLIACKTEGCSPALCDTIQIPVTIEDTPTSLVEVLNGLTIDVFPSPVNDWLQVNIEQPQAIRQDIQLELYNLNGQSLYRQSVQPGRHQIDFSNLAAGIYLLNVRTAEGQKTFKLVK
ncbi:MAG: T9SS type A sorting domain-containing protein [Bacteroidota bacterium]